MKVYIWGTGEIAEICLNDIFSNVEILGFVESIPNKKFFHGFSVISGKDLSNKVYDYLIIANSYGEEIKEKYSLDRKKVIDYMMVLKEDERGKILFEREISKEIKKEEIFISEISLSIINKARNIMPCISLETNEVKFLFEKGDNLIPNEIVGYGRPYAEKEMEFLNTFTSNRSQGYFFDIGANVGTTSIYYKKKFAPNLKYIAFEPLKMNYKYLKMNTIINDCEDIIVENIGLSNMNEEKKMLLFDGAYGSSMISDEKRASQICQFLKLDDYVRENGIVAEEISYLWVDVQNHEVEVIEGALETLKKSRASLYIEFNIGNLKHERGKVEKFICLLSNIYSKFICYEQYKAGKKENRENNELVNLPNEISVSFCNILFMK